MKTTTVTAPPTVIRWLVVLTNLGICVTLVTAILRSSHLPADTMHVLSVIAIAFSAYAWVLFPTGGSVLLSLTVLVCLVWLWAARSTVALGIDVGAMGLLMVVAAVQQRRRARQFKRLQQVVDDVDEERTVKDQAIALANQTREGLQKKLSRYTHLQLIAEELSNVTDEGAIANLAVERAFALIGKSDTCLLFLVDKERQELSLFASKKREIIATIRAKHGDQFDRHVLRTHRPLLVNDVRRDFRFTVTVSPERSVSSVIACPLFLGESPEGVLRLDSAQPGAYTQDDLRFLDILLDLVATAMTNAKLFAQTQQLAMTDGLTGLTLRRPFLEQLTRELLRAGRTREPASILMLDIDHFKDYNDTFGHSAGDVILKAVAQVLRDVVPPGGVTARYGGEEFAILLPRLGRQPATDVAERIRGHVAQHVQGGVHVPARDVAASVPATRAVSGSASRESGPRRKADLGARVTVSLGVATCPDDAQAELELIRIADERLYRAKRSGRNLVVCS